MALDPRQKKALKKQAHHLKPVVRIGQHGLTEGVIAETGLCLDLHQLIKVHVHQDKQEKRTALATELAKACEAELVHHIGKVCVLYRKRREET